jgi:hypothetical protein
VNTRANVLPKNEDSEVKKIQKTSTTPQTPEKSKRNSVSSLKSEEDQISVKLEDRILDLSQASFTKPQDKVKKISKTKEVSLSQATKDEVNTSISESKKSDNVEVSDSSKGMLMFKEIESSFKQALKLVEELEKAAGGNPCSKMAFKKELTSLLTACKAKARRVI